MPTPDRITQIGQEFDKALEKKEVPETPPALSLHTQIAANEAEKFGVHISTRTTPFIPPTSSELKINIFTGYEQDPEWD